MAKKPAPTSYIPTQGIAQVVDSMTKSSEMKRKPFERRWYDNNFFDDGFHFRYVSRQTGRVIDLSQGRHAGGLPMRAIPKASRQLRGVVNLLLAADYVPVIYPEKVSPYAYPRQAQDPETGQVVYPDYIEAQKRSKEIANKVGHWLTEEFDEQDIQYKIIEALLLAGKHGVSYMQIWADSVEEKIKSEVFDAFDIYLEGDLTSIYDSPYIIKAKKEFIARIKANELFDKGQVEQINADNKYASSEIKQAYMNKRYGNMQQLENNETLILKEAFLKEYINDDNREKVRGDLKEAYKDYKDGDPIIRQVYSAGGVWLRDKYIDLNEYPFVDFRLEPGPIYQVPLIERFIPANKSLDILASRVEAYANTMVTGVYQKRKGENYEINNTPGGQIIEYEGRPLEQMQQSSIPSYMFNFMGFLEKIMEEQGAATSTLGALPDGVRSGVAIESLKATEFANLKIPTKQLQRSVKEIAKRFLDLASKLYVTPQDVELLEQGEPSYFEVIGESGIEAYKKIHREDEIQNMVPIKSDYRVRIEIESGLGFTMEGKKQSMQQIIDYMTILAERGLLTKEAVQIVTDKFLEIFQFGSTAEFMEAMDRGAPVDMVTDDDIQKMKIGLLEVLNDAGVVGQEKEQQQIDTTKVGVMEAVSDLEG